MKLTNDGYAAIVCAWPNTEEAGKALLAEIAREAEKSIKAVYIPIAGSPSTTQIYQLRKMMEDTKGPVLGYRSFGSGTSVKHQDDAMIPLLRISADLRVFITAFPC